MLLQFFLGQQCKKCQQGTEGEVFGSMSTSQGTGGACTVTCKTLELLFIQEALLGAFFRARQNQQGNEKGESSSKKHVALTKKGNFGLLFA